MTGMLLAFFLLLPGVGAAQAQPPQVGEILALLAKGHAKGSEAAPVTIIEFSDFQCSFCWKFWKETLPRLEMDYIKTGKIRFVYRHLAILGEHSLAAAQAAECAGEQGKFWEFHDILFGSKGPFSLTNGRLSSPTGPRGALRVADPPAQRNAQPGTASAISWMSRKKLKMEV